MTALTNALCGTYVALTLIKVTQLVLETVRRRMTTTPAGKGVVEYCPSLVVAIWMLDWIMGQDKSLTKVPRKTFREVTDPWVQRYNAKVLERRQQGVKPKVFTNLHEAKEHFFLELCQDTSAKIISYGHQGTQMHNLPLGLSYLCVTVFFLALVPFHILREKLVFGGNPITFICKLAAAITVTDVYVVACKESLSFNEALTRYPWVSGIFVGEQIHPMIGKAVCPLYKRELEFPKDVMEFEYEVVEGAMLGLRQRRSSWAGRLWEDVLVCHYVLPLLALYLTYTDLSWIRTVAPYAAAFYLTRELIDWQLGIHWHPKYHCQL